eukprot:TCALIF_04395-PA protein Name:"Similar to TCF25 Transcription factor 25 (Homo sapiens)" AED:0.08 eAED:0.08 QI:269/0.62/0.55/1/1/1/9/131/672
MSSRVLRKLQGQNDLIPSVEPQVEQESNDDEHDLGISTPDLGGARPKKLNVNPFDLLNADSQSESEVKEDDDLGTESSRSQLQREDTKKKKRKKNRKRSQNSTSGGAKNLPLKSSEADEALSFQTFSNQLYSMQFEDEIDRGVYEVNKLLGTTHPQPNAKLSSTTKVTPKSRAILSIEFRHLNPENEMKKIFGSRVVQAEASRQRRAGGGRHRAPLRSVHNIVIPKPNWPNPGRSGLTMKFVESDAKGNQVFTFDHSPEYQQVQKQFLAAVDSMNPDYIVHIVQQHPFHIDSMLQLSDISRMGEDLQMATELIERCIYALETAFHPMFNLATGNCRLYYRVQVNRACHRTALEFCKLILSLDPEADPMGILLLIDFYAIRAQQHNWLIQFFNEWDPTRNLSQLPNWAYSIAIAYFAQAEESEDNDYAKADEMLQTALIMFPSMLRPLLDKCNIEADSRVVLHPYFLEDETSQSGGLALLCNLYVGRSFHLWKLPELLPWLERNAQIAIQRINANEEFVLSCQERRKTRYQGAPRNVYRHVIMSDISDATTSLPMELAQSPVLNFDPLPPIDSIDLYTKRNQGNMQYPPGDPNALSLFFRSMMPNYNPATDQVGAVGGDQPGGEAGGQTLRNSVNMLYEAMADMMRNFDLPEVAHDGADSEDSDDENDNREWD